MSGFAEVIEEFAAHGHAVVPGFLSADEIAPALDQRERLFPSADEFAGDGTTRERFLGDQFAGVDYFPFASDAWNLLAVNPRIVGLARTLLTSDDIRIYQAEAWAKYTGAVDYDQSHHRDYGNHTIVVPSADDRFAHLEMFVYLTDVAADTGPTRVVPSEYTRDLPMMPKVRPRDLDPELYDHEIEVAGPPGTLLVYRPDTFHRGTQMTRPDAARFTLHINFRRTAAEWVLRRGWGQFADSREWERFVERASVDQLGLFGFPLPGHDYWTDETLGGVGQRYPGLDLTPWRQALA